MGWLACLERPNAPPWTMVIAWDWMESPEVEIACRLAIILSIFHPVSSHLSLDLETYLLSPKRCPKALSDIAFVGVLEVGR